MEEMGAKEAMEVMVAPAQKFAKEAPVEKVEKEDPVLMEARAEICWCNAKCAPICDCCRMKSFSSKYMVAMQDWVAKKEWADKRGLAPHEMEKMDLLE
jgi:hypothetical protein